MFFGFFIVTHSMIILISPAKSLNLDPSISELHSTPVFQKEANRLVKDLRQYSSDDLQNLMSVSTAIADENVRRFKQFKMRSPEKVSKNAVELFAGDVYKGLNVSDFSKTDFEFAQKHLRILSGLYGVLKPGDQIQPYRLEMGTRLKTDHGNNLYDFWDNKITKEINKALKESGDMNLVNLASNEYFKSIKKAKLKANVININFKEYHQGTLKFLSFNAKVARGMMTRYIIKNRIADIQDLKGFDMDNYSFSEEHSTDQNWLFIR